MNVSPENDSLLHKLLLLELLVIQVFALMQTIEPLVNEHYLEAVNV